MKFNPRDWLEPTIDGDVYRLNERSIEAGAGPLNMNNRGNKTLHLSTGYSEDGAQFCGIIEGYHWQHDVSVSEGELTRLCPKCFAILARNDAGGPAKRRKQ